jgi:hypothetical protein
MQPTTLEDQQLSTSNVTVQQQQQQQQQKDGSLFVSPFKGPKIAWKKQFKRINIVSDETTTVERVQQQNDSSSSSLGSNSVNNTCDSSVNVSEGGLEKPAEAFVTEKTAEDNCNKENVITKVVVPSTPTKKSSKRKVISPCTILANNNEEQRQPDTNLASKEAGFNLEGGGAQQETKLEDTKFTSPRERKLAKRIVLNRVNTINHNSSSSKVALRFVF